MKGILRNQYHFSNLPNNNSDMALKGTTHVMIVTKPLLVKNIIEVIKISIISHYFFYHLQYVKVIYYCVFADRTNCCLQWQEQENPLMI